eukprot:gb/GECH01009217.1/.p1 GENE.gb/GECH01009217.1/~~gb/GECH01009217.1/.p1  ORF type:complete len:187 (+),score=44.86 gb/GECH01009217.1/:1-561(+)
MNRQRHRQPSYEQMAKYIDKEIQNIFHGVLILTCAPWERNKINVGVKGARYLANVLKNDCTIKELKLGENRIGDRGLIYLCEALQENHGVTHLDLFGNSIGDLGCQYLKEMLKQNDGLRFLNLTRNFISDEGYQYLNEGLPYNCSMVQIWVDGLNKLNIRSRQQMWINEQMASHQLYREQITSMWN